MKDERYFNFKKLDEGAAEIVLHLRDLSAVLKSVSSIFH
jgi:hypothetical protein